jgi:hypothetical protein
MHGYSRSEAAVDMQDIIDIGIPGGKIPMKRLLEVLRVPYGRDRCETRGELTGLTLAGLNIGLLRNPRTCGPQEGARIQVRRPMTIGARHVDHGVLVLIAGGRDISVVIVHEGNEEV